MLRVTVEDRPRRLMLLVEGSLAGPCSLVLEETWESLFRRGRPKELIELTLVRFIDAASRACLAAFHRPRADLIVPDRLTRLAVAEITQDDRTPIRTPGDTRSRRHPATKR